MASNTISSLGADIVRVQVERTANIVERLRKKIAESPGNFSWRFGQQEGTRLKSQID
jgi:hypothetical protein